MLSIRSPLEPTPRDTSARAALPQPPASAATPPRLIVRTVAATFSGFAVLLAVVGLVWLFDAQRRADRSAAHDLSEGQRAFERLLARRSENREVVATRLTASTALIDALSATPSPALSGGVATDLHGALDALGADAVAVVDAARRVVVAEGPNAGAWTPGTAIMLPSAPGAAPRPTALFRRDAVSLVWLYPIRTDAAGLLGEVVIETRLDAAYARSLAMVTHTEVAIFWSGQLVASSLAEQPALELARLGPRRLGDGTEVTLGGERFHVGRFRDLDNVALIAVEPRAEAEAQHATALWLALAVISLGALLLGALVSWWLAHSYAKPLGELASSAERAMATRTYDTPLPPSRSSREVHTLTGTFNTLLLSLDHAESHMRSTSIGAIRALAAALDARDPYTAGHSERVSNLAVAIGRQMALGDDDLEVLRLGGLLHDIGKIGVADDILLKTTTLAPDEEEAIRTHPRTGARILSSVPFLAPHLPIVELHHERPDGLGYPHGLAGDAIPLLARIVRVADAFDAMTSARAYRRAMPVGDAVSELWQQAGTGFDAGVVDAFLLALPLVRPGFTRELASTPHIEHLRARPVLAFRK